MELAQKLGVYAVYNRRPHDRSWSRFGMIPDCDGRSDGQTDGQMVRQNLSWLIQCFA